jgi:hypothetical protein
MPDEWELAHGFKVEDAADAMRDADGDGQDNLSEYRAGTDPASAESCLRLERVVRTSDSTVRFDFSAVSNRSYGLEARVFPDGRWEPLLSWPAAESNRVLTVTQPVPSILAPPLLYRVLTPPMR